MCYLVAFLLAGQWGDKEWFLITDSGGVSGWPSCWQYFKDGSHLPLYAINP